jgi:hypothetical protein
MIAVVRARPRVRGRALCRRRWTHRRGPLTDPTAGARRLYRDRAIIPTGVVGARPHTRARRLRASLIEAMVTKVARISARFSKSLASRRLRPNQEKVRPTTHRRGSTTKPSERRRRRADKSDDAPPSTSFLPIIISPVAGQIMPCTITPRTLGQALSRSTAKTAGPVGVKARKELRCTAPRATGKSP